MLSLNVCGWLKFSRQPLDVITNARSLSCTFRPSGHTTLYKLSQVTSQKNKNAQVAL